ncbi:MAG: hypothetical protein WB767_13265, partial [Nocardioides sp.]
SERRRDPVSRPTWPGGSRGGLDDAAARISQRLLDLRQVSRLAPLAPQPPAVSVVEQRASASVVETQ